MIFYVIRLEKDLCRIVMNLVHLHHHLIHYHHQHHNQINCNYQIMLPNLHLLYKNHLNLYL